ncbi:MULTISPECIES: magnesium transporter CorA family protein [Aerococcus]|uniref:Magnesium transporter CorA family protein n=1 Tax=Aerococcus sanguinicola TaxID=119206 RepID=A0A5N1GMR1_9LACT|nr:MULTISPECIES: magnesium transporter CorA family protein [Aerococcus]KAA9302082.1 magnesium transporter CorA family protein [Aerococcus sanguinicola]MDK6368492.1 magnesium transporter CorA family protein [Aerococcus sp. UMB9870]MDK6686419.1 magnesium transporter CorA family protein [Aerococcus sp. UMB8623]OFK22090.1 magnesium transporter CorA [Aerococcus sp. HMSC072A12]OFR34237.1 magnesium transporter CorA [Aerococcus sp. HMSC061A03]
MIGKVIFGPKKANTWVNIQVESPKVLQKHLVTYGIDAEMAAYALDRNERARVEYDDDHDCLLLIYNAPKRRLANSFNETFPVTFFIKDQRIISISNEQNQYIIDGMRQILTTNKNYSIHSFLFECLYFITTSYFPIVESMVQERNRLTKELRERTTKDNLLGLSDLETGTAYFLTSAKQNVLLLEQFRLGRVAKALSDDEIDELEDVQIEAKQLVEMTELSSQILEQLGSTFNNVLNNNLNETMRVLTVLSIILTIPTIVTGFFGMNMPLPGVDSPLSWIGTIIFSIIVGFLVHILIKFYFKD